MTNNNIKSIKTFIITFLVVFGILCIICLLDNWQFAYNQQYFKLDSNLIYNNSNNNSTNINNNIDFESCCNSGTLCDKVSTIDIYGTVTAYSEQYVAIDENNFPDENFRKWLKNSNNIGGAGADGMLSTEEISQVTEISIKWEDGLNITSLKGIEYFTALKRLSVTDQLITELNLSNNTQLTSVNCSYNRLTKLNLSNLNKLINLNCEYNMLNSLDLSDNTELVVLYCRHNLLKYLPLDSNTKLEFIETFDNLLVEIDVSMLQELRFLHIDHNKLTELDMSKNLKLEGGGFVVRNNFITKVMLPTIDNFTVFYDDFAEQDPIKGYARVQWYLDEDYTIPLTTDLQAQGQTLYCKRIANDYTVKFDANGGKNAPQAIATVYDTQFELPTDIPTRTGYTFSGWSQYSDGTGKQYNAGDSVINLAGHKDFGERTTLYAVWQPIPYTVGFEANASEVSGVMQDIVVQYGQVFTLPDNQFVKAQYELVGWALSPYGSVKYLNRQAVSNLSADGGKVTLYAIWQKDAESLRQPFVEQLDNAFSSVNIENYYIEDYNSMLSAYNDALSTLIKLDRDTIAMQKVVNQCINSINSTMNMEQRIAQITQGWRREFHFILGSVNSDTAINLGEGQRAYNQAKQALDKSDRVQLSQYTTLTETDSIDNAINSALEILNEDIVQLNNYVEASMWQISADNYIVLANSEITSKMVAPIQNIIDSYQVLSQQSLIFISDITVQKVYFVLRLAQSKYDALLTLQHNYELLAQQEYSEQCWQQVTVLYENSLSNIEQADSLSNIQTNLQQGIELMKEVPLEVPTTPEPVPPDEPDQPQQPNNPDGQDKPTKPTNNKVLMIVLSCVISVVAISGVGVIVYLVVTKKTKK